MIERSVASPMPYFMKRREHGEQNLDLTAIFHTLTLKRRFSHEGGA